MNQQNQNTPASGGNKDAATGSYGQKSPEHQSQDTARPGQSSQGGAGQTGKSQPAITSHPGSTEKGTPRVGPDSAHGRGNDTGPERKGDSTKVQNVDEVDDGSDQVKPTDGPRAASGRQAQRPGEAPGPKPTDKPQSASRYYHGLYCFDTSRGGVADVLFAEISADNVGSPLG